MHDRYEVWKSAEGVNCLIAAPKVSFMSEFCIYYSMGPHPMQHAIVEKKFFQTSGSFSRYSDRICCNETCSQEYAISPSLKLLSKTQRLEI